MVYFGRLTIASLAILVPPLSGYLGGLLLGCSGRDGVMFCISTLTSIVSGHTLVQQAGVTQPTAGNYDRWFIRLSTPSGTAGPNLRPGVPILYHTPR